MSKRVLSVIDTAYRACQEEQDDAGLWFSAAVNNAGVEISMLLTGNAVNYAVREHRETPLEVGGGVVAHPFVPTRDLERLSAKGVDIYLVREDAEIRGIADGELLPIVERVSRESLPDLVDRYDAIWHW